MCVVRDDIDFLLKLPFEKIYHDKWVEEIEKSKIMYHRCAEVIIPEYLDLSNLKIICCRSQAEFETFTSLLPFKSYTKWRKIITVDSKSMLFFSRWTFIKKAGITAIKILFICAPDFFKSPITYK